MMQPNEEKIFARKFWPTRLYCNRQIFGWRVLRVKAWGRDTKLHTVILPECSCQLSLLLYYYCKHLLYIVLVQTIVADMVNVKTIDALALQGKI